MKSDINVTPLVDVVLVLLIVFLVVTPMLNRGKAVDLPTARRVAELSGGGDPIVVSITRDGRRWLNGADVPQERLAEALGAEMSRAPAARIVLQADRALDYATVRAVVREIAKTGAPGLSLAAAELREPRQR